MTFPLRCEAGENTDEGGEYEGGLWTCRTTGNQGERKPRGCLLFHKSVTLVVDKKFPDRQIHGRPLTVATPRQWNSKAFLFLLFCFSTISHLFAM